VNARGVYLWEHGEFITYGGDVTGPFAFYQLHDFYVEVLFDLEFNTVVSVVPFNEGDRYERMLTTMEVPGS